MILLSRIGALTAFSLMFFCHSYAQAGASKSNALFLGKVPPYRMEVTYNKTSHLIFPTAIRYVDLGSEYLIASKAEDAENVLRVKAAIKDFTEETNFSVITEDGRFYNFNVVYSPQPAAMSYDMQRMQSIEDRTKGSDVLFEELGSDSPSLAALLMERIYKRNKRIIKHIASKSFGIQFELRGIYIHHGKFYFNTGLQNTSNVPFNIDFINFKVVDKKVAKRTVVQQRSLTPLREYKPLGEVMGGTTEGNVFLLDQFTLTGDKELVIEIFEKNGGRQQTLTVENSDLVHAKRIKDMHLQIH